MKHLTMAAAAGLLVTQFSFPTIAAAYGLQITPGLWRITSTSTNMMGGPKTETEDQCMEEEVFDPIAELQDGGDGCEVSNQNLENNTLTFDMSCSGPGGPQMTGTGLYTIDGNNGSGEMSYSMQMGSQTITMSNSWTAERIGDCP